MTVLAELIEITLLSLFVSSSATVVATVIGIPLGLLLGLKKFKGRLLLKGAVNSMMALPTVALGLILYLVFSNSGPLGVLHLLYSPLVIIIGQAILVLPIIMSISSETVENINPGIRDLSLTLGANERGAFVSVLRESVGGVVLAVSAAFSRAISELGVALMLGGNIEGNKRRDCTWPGSRFSSNIYDIDIQCSSSNDGEKG
jgi:tungstate transport system permease protein